MMNLNVTKKTKTPIENITKDILIELYYDNKMSLNDIGKHFGYYDRQPIQRLFKKFEIETKTPSQANKDLNHGKYDFPNIEEMNF